MSTFETAEAQNQSKHFWTMLTAEGKLTRGELKHTPEAIEIWAVELARTFGGRPIGLALEQKRGALVAILSKYAHLHLFPLHPTKLGHYRESVCSSGAKSDPSDADLILDYLVKHPEWLPCLVPDTVETRSLQFLVEERRKLVNQHTSQLQILIYWLKQMFPQMLVWFDDMSTPLVGDLLQRSSGNGPSNVILLAKARPISIRGNESADSWPDWPPIAGAIEGIAEDAAQVLCSAQLPERRAHPTTAG